ncbi:Catenin-beta-like protein [Dioszegia hungarica]|uniref:Catenin-beta-like protein n=1 Tax=Dioszegia hungarica TaxID=4972 RepID=A0AA38LPI9_9TREE|nr:Catenin-beta-like protein [Dioszegia hungarica]KAI9632157.1 Catenin-beta-like protein [Dioszegia hungarica]
MDIDKMFKLPALPTGSLKRKMTSLPTQDMLKRFKSDDSEDTSANGKGKGRAATVEDVNEDAPAPEDMDDDMGQGDDDEDGRFFGGGLNNEQQQILDIFDKAGDDDGDAGTTTLPALRRQFAKFERTVAKNAEQRGKFPDDPSKFIDSEADLDTSLKSFLPLTQNAPLSYPELIRSGTVALLTNLLSHENTDIAMDVVEVVQELTDEDVGAEVDDLEEEEKGGGGMGEVRRVMGDLIDELLNNSLLDLLTANLSRLDESEPTDSQGVFSILGVFENLLSFLPPLATQIVGDTTLLPWLLKRVQKKEYDSNKQYASEVLSILLQGGREVVVKVWEQDGVEVLLKVLSQYRKKDPGDSEEVEFMENMFNCLCSLLGEPEVKTAFIEAEGTELMIIMMKEKLLARTRAMKVLDYAMQTEAGTAACEKFVESQGLKSFFSLYMGKVCYLFSLGSNEPKKKSTHATPQREDEEHLLSILSSLFTNLPSESPSRIRVIMKFVENEYEKVERLLELRERAKGALVVVEKEIREERNIMLENQEEVTEEEEDDWYLRRIEAGLAALQTADYVLAWVCMEDDGARAHAQTLLSRKSQSLSDILASLQEFRRNIGVGGDGEEEMEEEGEDDPEARNKRVILAGLMGFLEGCV